MFNLEEFYAYAHRGEKCDRDEMISYINHFETVIIWGAGNLGRDLGRSLIEKGVKISFYWDAKAQEIKNVNGVPVYNTFSNVCNKETSVVIASIANGSGGKDWTSLELRKEGFDNIIDGVALYEGIECPLGKDFFDISECTGRKACSLCNCERYTNILNERINHGEGSLTFQLMTFIISTRCTLNCKYCGQRLAQYDKANKVDYSVDSICRDFDNFMNSVDFVGMISVIGGEPFIHPNIVEIVKYFLERNNFGVLNITTNGVVKITEKMLADIRHPRVKISFSVYDSFLSEKQKEVLNRNMDLVAKSGISYSISRPLWLKPAELIGHDYSDSQMKSCKQACGAIKMTAAVKNGVFYPCSIAENIDGLNLFPVGNSTVDVSQEYKLRERLLDNINLDFYDACRYCSFERTEEIPAGEQINE